MSEIPRQKKIRREGIVSTLKIDFTIAFALVFGMLGYLLVKSFFVPVITVSLAAAYLFATSESFGKYYRFTQRLRNVSYYDKKMDTLLDVKSIKHDLVFLNNGEIRAIIKVIPFDFEILDEEMQFFITQLFRFMMRSIDFSVMIHSESIPVNLNPWPQKQEAKIISSKVVNKKPKLEEFKGHVAWIYETIHKNNARDRSFEFIIRHKPTLGELMEGKSILGKIKLLFTFNNILQHPESSPELELIMRNISNNLDLCMERLDKMRTKVHRLTTDELISRFMSNDKKVSVYNSKYITPIMFEDEDYEI